MSTATVNGAPAATHDDARYGELFIDLERAKLDLLKVTQEIAEGTRAFYDDGIALSMTKRNALHAEKRQLEIAVQTLKIEAMQAKELARALKMRTFAALLVSKAQAAGLSVIVEEARAESLAALEAAGLTTAYRMKGPA